MHPFPHTYIAVSEAGPSGDAALRSADLPALATQSPEAFGGPGDRWSPETLLMGAVADCFVLTFRSVAGAARFPWTSLECEAEGTLDRVDHVTRFTDIRVRATLRVAFGADESRAHDLLGRAERLCLITNSLSAQTHLESRVRVAHEIGIAA